MFRMGNLTYFQCECSVHKKLTIKTRNAPVERRHVVEEVNDMGWVPMTTMTTMVVTWVVKTGGLLKKQHLLRHKDFLTESWALCFLFDHCFATLIFLCKVYLSKIVFDMKQLLIRRQRNEITKYLSRMLMEPTLKLCRVTQSIRLVRGVWKRGVDYGKGSYPIKISTLDNKISGIYNIYDINIYAGQHYLMQMCICYLHYHALHLFTCVTLDFGINLYFSSRCSLSFFILNCAFKGRSGNKEIWYRNRRRKTDEWEIQEDLIKIMPRGVPKTQRREDRNGKVGKDEELLLKNYLLKRFETKNSFHLLILFTY